MRPTSLLLVVMLAALRQSQAQTSAMTPQQAVEAISSAWTPNPLFKDPSTHEPVSTKGSWGVQRVAPGSTSLAECKDGPACLIVLYRIAEPATLCTWTVAPPLPPAAEPRVVDLSETAAAMMLRKRAPVDGPHWKPITIVKPDLPRIATATHARGFVEVHVIVSAQGTVTVEGASGPPLLVEPAKAAAAKHVFAPILVNGRPIVVRGDIDMEFGSGKPDTLEQNLK